MSIGHKAPAWVLAALLTLHLLFPSGSAQLAEPFVFTSANASQKTRNEGSSALVRSGDGKVQLKLCECERAMGAPNGLSCDKQGWFITSFERQGQWVAGGGYVPLSHAICCRPCLPDEVPEDASGRVPEGTRPLGIMSLGCHTSTDALPVRCEGSGRSFATGFSESVRVFTATDTFYPVNTINCCTPSLLLDNGDAWELERCDCHDAKDTVHPVNCGGLDTNELLFGYIFYRVSPLGHLVPVGPAQCCKVCLSPTFHPMDECDDLAQCSRNGVCNLGQCECFEGWSGADCSKYVGRGGSGGRGQGVPPWAITLIVLSSCALAGVFLVAAGHIIRLIQEEEDGSNAGEEERQPLILRIDPDDAGSVGSQDTECDEEDVEEVQERVSNVIARLEERTPGISGYHPPAIPEGGAAAEREATAEDAGAAAPATASLGPASTAAAVVAAGLARFDGGAESGEESLQESGTAAERQEASAAGPAVVAAEAGEGDAPAVEAAAGPEVAASAEHAALRFHPILDADNTADSPTAVVGTSSAAAAAEGKENGEGEASTAHAARREPDPLCPLNVVDCIICFSRPVQVVLVPCGHVCMCRRCSRKVNRCPVCRKDIARRQKIWI